MQYETPQATLGFSSHERCMTHRMRRMRTSGKRRL